MAVASWSCPECGQVVTVEAATSGRTTSDDTSRGRESRRSARVVTVTLDTTALADVFAHVWTHGDAQG